VTDLLVVVSARPNFMKAASVLPAARAVRLDTVLLHTGQHYDEGLSRVFFDELELDEPEVLARRRLR
jgi:UDP-N-acetylglucosamine 2-epimerase